MKKRICQLDRFLYIIACVLTFGFIILIRIVISEGVRQALEHEME